MSKDPERAIIDTCAANEAWVLLLSSVIYDGRAVTSRKMMTKELINTCIKVHMSYPELNLPERKINNKFRAAEAAWILSGDNKVDTISKYCEKYAQYSDDGIFMNGAYGPPVVDQLPYIIKALLKDRFTRQAVISIWRPKPGESKDIPCTISLQFLIRNGELHCVANMRSNDIWLGTPYDIYTFSMIARYIIVSEKKFRVRGLQPGFLYLNSGSTHIYEQDLKKAKKLIRDIPLVVHQESCANYNSLWKGITNEFSSGRELVDFLWSQANN